MRCLTSNRMSMNAEVLTWTGIVSTTGIPVGTGGDWSTYQDEITGELMNKWVPSLDSDDPFTTENEALQTRTIPCAARGVVQGGIRVAGTTERFGDSYENIDFVNMWVPANVIISKRDRITNIRSKKGGVVVWTDEEFGGRPTVFNVNGVTPLFDAYNRHIENYVMLEKAQ